ncbi:MAG: DNA-3-methyladenine glycosylase I [Oscillospiraceae bacterium]|nr:DNA-3-methyladenine glycosylase I [Oscillospiraceae bacterium]
MNEKIRCRWTGESDIYINYHDSEWGRPVHDDGKLFEMLLLETMQAGLSWITILKKRESYRKAFDGFDASKIVLYDNKKIESLMLNEGIIRNRLKINSAINNAKIFLDIKDKQGSFNNFIWSYVNNTPIIGKFEKIEDLPSTTPLSDRLSKDLKKMGFKFIGSTTIYSFMQATGMVNDHITDCFVYKEMLNGI